MEIESHPLQESYMQSRLPSEILLLILQFLPPLEKLRVRATCRRLYSAASDPAAWPSVALDYYSTRDKKAMTAALRLCAPGVRRLSIDAHGKSRFPFVHASKLITQCKNLHCLSVLGFYPTTGQIDVLLTALPMLAHLRVDVQISGTEALFELPALGSSLKLYEVRIPEVKHFFTLNILRVWQEHQFIPRKFRLSSKSNLVVNIAEIKDFSSNYFHPLPPDGKAQFQLMQSELPLGLAPARPVLEINIGSSCSVSVAYGDGMPTCYPLVLVLSPPQSAIHYPTDNCHQICVNVPFLSIAQSLVHLSLKGCTDVHSTDLEKVADYCPLLQSLNLEFCTNALICLKGLQNVARKCLRLEGLNVDGIHDIEDTTLLWRILRGILKLFYLAVAGCSLPVQCDADSSGEERDVSSLLVLEINCFDSCMKCRSVSDRHIKALSQLGLDHLRYLRMSLPPVSIGLQFRELFSRLPCLQCFYVKKRTPGMLSLPDDEGVYRNLEKCYIECWDLAMSDSLVAALVSSRTLTHLYLKVKSVSKEAMCMVIKLPRLVSCHTRFLNSEDSRRRTQQMINRAARAQSIPDFSCIAGFASLETDLKSLWCV